VGSPEGNRPTGGWRGGTVGGTGRRRDPTPGRAR